MIAAKAKTVTSSCIHQTLVAIFLLVVYYFCLINFFFVLPLLEFKLSGNSLYNLQQLLKTPSKT